MPKFIIKLDKEKCIGCGTCVAVCPANFELKDDGKAHLIKKEVDSLGCSQIAAETCPTEAIRVDPIK